VVFPRWQGDVAEVLEAAAAGRLASSLKPSFAAVSAVCVVMAAPGYPISPVVGDPIAGIDDAAMLEGVSVYAAGVGRDNLGRLVSAGGRVLGVTAVAARLAEARAKAYNAVAMIDWPGAQYRTDIAERAEQAMEGRL
jgi:phosphoribosylamine--glycine ligase